jgi:hypothetical protein
VAQSHDATHRGGILRFHSLDGNLIMIEIDRTDM